MLNNRLTKIMSFLALFFLFASVEIKADMPFPQYIQKCLQAHVEGAIKILNAVHICMIPVTYTPDDDDKMRTVKDISRRLNSINTELSSFRDISIQGDEIYIGFPMMFIIIKEISALENSINKYQPDDFEDVVKKN